MPWVQSSYFLIFWNSNATKINCFHGLPEGIKRVFSSFEREVKHFKTNPKPREHFELADKVEHAEIVFVITSVNDFFPSD